jgi:hypothetical protein
MVSPCDNQPHVWLFISHRLESLDQNFRAFVGSPLSKGNDLVYRITAAREVRILRTLRKNAVGPKMNVSPTVFIQENAAVGRH